MTQLGPFFATPKTSAGPWPGACVVVLLGAVGCTPIEELQQPLVMPAMQVAPTTDFPTPASLNRHPDSKTFVFELSDLNLDTPDSPVNPAEPSASGGASTGPSQTTTAPAAGLPGTPPQSEGGAPDLQTNQTWLPLVVDPAIRRTPGTVRRNAAGLVRVDGVTTALTGDVYYSSDGTFTRRSGDTYLHSDGTTTVRRGNVFFHSDGTNSRVIDNRIERSTGGSCIVRDDTAICR